MVTTLLPDINQSAELPLAATLWPDPLPYDPGEDLAWALAAFAARRDEYALYDAYLAGRHRIVVATQAYETNFRELLARARANICPAVVRAFTDRLKIVGFSPRDDTTDEAGAREGWRFWQDRRLARVANWAHGLAVGLGDAYLHVWPDEAGRAQVYAHGGDAFVARYDPEHPASPAFAARLWAEEPTRDQGRRYRLNLYYADRIERYRSGPAAAGVPTNADAFAGVAGEGQPWRVANPWGLVPVFPLVFEGGPGRGGRSALAEVIPLQDQLNKSIIDRAVAMEFGAWPQRYAIGLEPEQATDSAGNLLYHADGTPKWAPLPFRVGLDRLLTLANPDGKFGSFEATDLGPYTETIMSFLDLVAATTGIPPHLLHRGLGTPPSGEALKTAETRLVARVEDTQVEFGDVWEDAIAFALAIERGQRRVVGVGAPPARVQAAWRPAVSRAERERAETVGVLRQQVGLPLEAALDLLDYTAEQQRAILAQARREQAFAADLVAGDGSATLRAELGEEDA